MQDKFKMLQLENVKKKRGILRHFWRVKANALFFLLFKFIIMKIMKNKLTNSQTNKITAIS